MGVLGREGRGEGGERGGMIPLNVSSRYRCRSFCTIVNIFVNSERTKNEYNFCFLQLNIFFMLVFYFRDVLGQKITFNFAKISMSTPVYLK